MGDGIMLAASHHPILYIPPLPNKKYLLATNYHIYPSTQEHDIQPFLSAKKMETFIHAFITSLLEYCNYLVTSAVCSKLASS